MRKPRVAGFLSLSSGTLFAQLLTVAVLPLLSRLYSPSDFGALAIVTAISSIVSPAVALKFDTAVLLAKSNREARGIVLVAVVFAVVLSSAWGVLAHFLTEAFLEGEPPAYTGFWVSGITLLTGLFMIFSQLALRERRYGQVASRTVIQAVGTSSSQLSFGMMSLGQLGLLTGFVLGRAVGLLALIPIAKNYFGRHTLPESISYFRKYWRFPVVFAPSALINAAGSQLPLLTLTAIYGLEFAGLLGMAERLISIPVGLVGTAIGQMFMAELAEMRRNGKPTYFRFFLQLSLFLSVCGFLGFGVLALSASWLIPLILGEDWAATVPLIQVLAVTGAIRLVATPLSRAISVFQRAKANIVIDLLRLTLMVFAIFIVSDSQVDAISGMWVLYGALAIVHSVTWFYVLFLLRAVGREDSSVRSKSLHR